MKTDRALKIGATNSYMCPELSWLLPTIAVVQENNVVPNHCAHFYAVLNYRKLCIASKTTRKSITINRRVGLSYRGLSKKVKGQWVQFPSVSKVMGNSDRKRSSRPKCVQLLYLPEAAALMKQSLELNVVFKLIHDLSLFNHIFFIC